jgi:hypothetical protein
VPTLERRAGLELAPAGLLTPHRCRLQGTARRHRSAGVRSASIAVCATVEEIKPERASRCAARAVYGADSVP